MTKHFIIRKVLFLLAIAITFVACNDDDDPEAPQISIESRTIYESATLINGLSNFVNAVNSANGNFVDVLNGSDPVTVLAPSNQAFEDLASQLGYSSAGEMLTDIDKDILAEILSYHVISGSNDISSLSGDVATTLGETVTFAIGEDDAVIVLDKTELPSTNTNGTIVAGDLDRSNGIIHSINKVLLPQSIIDAFSIDIRPNLYELAAYEGYPSLISAIDKVGLGETVTDPTAAKFSMLTPSDDAFTALLVTLGDDYNYNEDLEDLLYDFDNEVELNLLADILRYHLFEPETAAADLTAGSVETLLEGNSIDVIGGGVTSQFGDASATNANIEESNIGDGASNGVAYGIDKVLLPQAAIDFLDLLDSDDLLTSISANTSLSTLAAAVVALELQEELNDITNESMRPQGENEEDEAYEAYLSNLNYGFTYYRPATIFAPDNAAFQDLFDLLGPDYNSIADFDTDDERAILRDIILFHVVAGYLTSGDLEPGELTTEQGSSIEVIESLTQGIIVLGDATNTDDANITIADAPSRNGLTHTIDKVLLPQSAVDFINSLED